MGTVQKDGSILYAFSGRYQIAQQEALKAVLKHENIPFTTGVGPNVHVVMVEPQYGIRVREVIQQWYEAMYVVHTEVWSD